MLEIAPGHGRWTEYILPKAKEVILVDLAPHCIEFCKNRFSNYKHVHYYVNDGRCLNVIKDNSVDFIWSYDSFVHMEKNVIDSYFREFSRVLKLGGSAIIHHAGRNDLMLKFSFLKKYGSIGRQIFKIVSRGKADSGWRSMISKKMIRNMANSYKLAVKYQINAWGENGKYDCKLFGDYISKLIRD